MLLKLILLTRAFFRGEIQIQFPHMSFLQETLRRDSVVWWLASELRSGNVGVPCVSTFSMAFPPSHRISEPLGLPEYIDYLSYKLLQDWQLKQDALHLTVALGLKGQHSWVLLLQCLLWSAFKVWAGLESSQSWTGEGSISRLTLCGRIQLLKGCGTEGLSCWLAVGWSPALGPCHVDLTNIAACFVKARELRKQQCKCFAKSEVTVCCNLITRVRSCHIYCDLQARSKSLGPGRAQAKEFLKKYVYHPGFQRP